MKNLTAQAVYNADIYLRLSDDDGDKPESNSIKNQREFITEFLKSMPEIRIHAERKDDGFSGVDYFRPGIQQVLQDVRSGAVNCVVVKDLSRLGRNYIETGRSYRSLQTTGYGSSPLTTAMIPPIYRGRPAPSCCPSKT